MAYLHLLVTGTNADDNITFNGVKLLSASADEAQADDQYTISCPSGNVLTIDEAGAETAEWATAGVTFSTSGAETFVITEATLIAGWTTPNVSAGALTLNGVNCSGNNVSLTEGLYCIEYNNDTSTPLRPFLYIPTIEDDIDTLATNVMNCQCDCNIDAVAGQRYIKARAYLDLIKYKSAQITAATDITEINTMIGLLTDFLGGTEELCGSC